MNGPKSAQTSTRRERQKREREERILDAATRVFARKGFYGATIRDIAEDADVGDGTIYNYFEDKSDLVIRIMTRIASVEELPGALSAALDGEVPDFFVTAFQQRMDRIVEGEEMLRAVLPQVLIDPGLREPFYEKYVHRITVLLEEYVEAQIRHGRIKPVDVPLVVRGIQGMFVGLLFFRILGDQIVYDGWDKAPELLAKVILEGLGA